MSKQNKKFDWKAIATLVVGLGVAIAIAFEIITPKQGEVINEGAGNVIEQVDNVVQEFDTDTVVVEGIEE